MMPGRDDRVAVVGAGPAGLACAHDLAAYGYRPVVLDAADRPGGMMVLGIPTYRLRRDFTLSSLKDDGFAAVFMAVGAMRSRDLQVPGVELDGVLKAVDFLINANAGYRVELGDDVVVIGGGNVALDVARTALREIAAGRSQPEAGAQQLADGVEAAATVTLDVARVAMRMGARRVRIVALENRLEMPAHGFEIEEAENDGVELSPRGTIAVERDTLATSAPGIYAGGDVAIGPRNLIDAIGDGRRAAASIHRMLTGEEQ